MTTPRAIKSVLAGFLGTYTSRYSDYGGYWLFGFLVKDLQRLTVDLLAPFPRQAGSTLKVGAIWLAREKFTEQVVKAGVPLEAIREARLEIAKLPGLVQGSVNGQVCDGFRVSFKATAVMANGRVYERETVLFVAPHDPSIERRSARADDGWPTEYPTD